MTRPVYAFTTAADVETVMAAHADRFDTSAAWERACRLVWRDASYRNGVWQIDCDLADALMDLAVESQIYEGEGR